MTVGRGRILTIKNLLSEQSMCGCSRMSKENILSVACTARTWIFRCQSTIGDFGDAEALEHLKGFRQIKGSMQRKTGQEARVFAIGDN
jgi:hypothetical protein